METNKPNIRKRTARPHKFATIFDKVAAPMFKKRGFAAAKLVADWPLIVGDVYARYSRPKKIMFPRGKTNNGTLHIEVMDSATSLQLTAIEPQILERIATYFGYQPVTRIKLIHNLEYQSFDKTAITTKEPLGEEEQKRIAALVEGIEEEELVASLSALGEEILQHKIDEKQ